MTATKPAIKMPEFLVFAKALAVGLVGAEVWRASFYLGKGLAAGVDSVAFEAKAAVIFVVLLLCLIYATKRGAHNVVLQIGRSFRLDLLIMVGIGIWLNYLASPFLEKVHIALKNADPQWGGGLLLLLCTLIISPLAQLRWLSSKKTASQLYFIADEEIGNDDDDFLMSESQAKTFAETVLASGTHPGLVFGVDGPWGIGKTSFVNLAERYWHQASDQVIVCRFEPLRYASEPDLTDRLIREVSAAIQKNVFAPEFRSVASRYSRLIKGKADFSFFGFKLSLEPAQDTVDDLLDDIDDVLKKIGRRVIVVVDDLDRLDPKSTNNVLFATRRTFKLSQATYVLCYDTEILVASKEEDSKARDFLEKFVTVKLSLFIDSSSIRDFLQRDWQREENQLGAIPSDTMLKLGAILNELAEVLNGDLAAKYLPLVGNIRKVKRFVNSMLLMQLDRNDLGRTDFNKRDLINLVLLHLNYPGLFRRIYAEETEGRSGTFSVRRKYDEREFTNSPEFQALLDSQDSVAKFLLTQLFDARVLELADENNVDEEARASRACFNQDRFRNLEKYLKLIVRFAKPEPQETFILYQSAVRSVQQGARIETILMSSDFALGRGEHAHDQFWRVLVNQAHGFSRVVAEDAIDTLIEYLPHYSMIENNARGLRQRSVYSLLRLLDRAGWGRTAGRHLPNTPANIVEIARRIFGEQEYEDRGILTRLVAPDRGVLGWSDLMLFRLPCSADRQAQLYNLHSALIVDQDEAAPTTGLVNSLALMGMRKLSQEVFALFKRAYIDQGRNFFSEVSQAPTQSFFGEVSYEDVVPTSEEEQPEQEIRTLEQRVSAERSFVKSFVIYQLSNTQGATGSGVGCGYYNEHGADDGHGIARLMNAYVFNICFNLDIDEENLFHFLDYCLLNLKNSFFSGGDEEGYIASKDNISGGLDPMAMGRYWCQHREYIRQRVHSVDERSVITPNYIASYRQDLAGVFRVLDELAEEATLVDSALDRDDSPRANEV